MDKGLTARQLLDALQKLPAEFLDWPVAMPEPANSKDFPCGTVGTVTVQGIPEDLADGYVVLVPNSSWAELKILK